MADIETTRATVVGAVALIEAIGGGLGITVAFAATVPMHDPIRTALVDLHARIFSALAVVLRGLVGAWIYAARYVRRYTYRGNSRPIRRGQHRPRVVARWQAAQAYNVRPLIRTYGPGVTA